MSISFKSMTAISIFFLYLFISTFSSIYYITSLFLVLSVLKTLNDLSIGSVLIFSFFTSCLLILIYVHPKFTTTCYHSLYQILLEHFYSSSSVMTCNLWQCAQFCYIYSTFLYLIHSLAFYNSLLYIYIHCS